MRQETKLETRVKRWAQAQGILCLKLNLQGNTGWPDRVFLHLGRIVFIEFKAPGASCVGERNQPARIDELRKRGFDVGIFNEFNAACAFLATALLPKEGRKAGSVTSLCRPPIRPRDGEDYDGLRDLINPLKAEPDQVRARYRAATSSLQCLAQAVQGVEGIRAFKSGDPSRPAERKRARPR